VRGLLVFFLTLSSVFAETIPTKKFFLFTEITPLKFEWQELAVTDQSSFTQALEASWSQWFGNQKLPDNFEFSLCLETCHETQEETNSGKYFIKVSLNVTKTGYVSSTREWRFEWDGRVVLQDASKNTLDTYDVPKESRTWWGLDQKALNSNLASALYRAPLEAFHKINKRDFSVFPGRQIQLSIQGQKSVSDVFSLIELLKKEGQALGLKAELETFNSKEAKVSCTYQGEEKSFSDLLSRLKELKSSHNYRLATEGTPLAPVVKLISE
jgi:predicted CopG family antitoxin